MERVRLGKIELQVSRIAFGTWSFGGDWGRFDTDEATATIGRALELGITLFDTAQGYGFGAAERLLGGALWTRARREDVLVATKAASGWKETDCSETRVGAGCGRVSKRACGTWGPTTSICTRSTGPTSTHPPRRPPARSRTSWGGQDPPRRRLELRRETDRGSRSLRQGRDLAAPVSLVPS
jgi:hypothetical protein